MLKVLLVVLVLGLLIYLAIRMLEGRGNPGGGGGLRRRPQRPGPAGPTRPIGPDDDPDFLRDLDRKRRQAEGPEQ